MPAVLKPFDLAFNDGIGGPIIFKGCFINYTTYLIFFNWL